MEERHRCPIASGILFDTSFNNCLLQRGFYCPQWVMPGGKKERNRDASFEGCLIRELQEELSFDASHWIDPRLSFCVIKNQRLVKAFLIENIPYNSVFKPTTRYEVKVSEKL